MDAPFSETIDSLFGSEFEIRGCRPCNGFAGVNLIATQGTSPNPHLQETTGEGRTPTGPVRLGSTMKSNLQISTPTVPTYK